MVAHTTKCLIFLENFEIVFGIPAKILGLGLSKLQSVWSKEHFQRTFFSTFDKWGRLCHIWQRPRHRRKISTTQKMIDFLWYSIGRKFLNKFFFENCEDQFSISYVTPGAVWKRRKEVWNWKKNKKTETHLGYFVNKSFKWCPSDLKIF